MGNKNKNSSKTCATFFMVGLLAGFSGFLLGLLFAPQSGRKFRQIIADKLVEIVDRSKFAVVEARVKAEEFIDKSREKAEEFMDKSREKEDEE